MNYLGFVLAVSIFSVVQAGEYPAIKLAQASVALVGNRYGKESKMISPEIEAAVDALYAFDYTATSNGEVFVFSRADFKGRLKEAKGVDGLWKFTDVSYIPDNRNTTCCKMKFRCWTEKSGVFDVEATVCCSIDGGCIQSINQTVEQVYTAEEVS